MSPIEWVRPRTWLLAMAVVSMLVVAFSGAGANAQEEAATSDAAADEAAADAPTDDAVADAPAADEATDAEPAAAAQDGFNKSLTDTSYALDTVWVLVTAFLVMWMQAGFALVETGLTRAKNAVNICMKNLLDFCFGSLTYWIVGFSIMFGTANWFWGGLNGMFLNTENESFASLSWSLVPLDAKFFFQLVFAATTATIVSGAMAERTKFVSYMVYSAIVSAVIYPISGHWIWGGGWLGANQNFWDFAGSTVVHSCGGWLALAGAILLGPRLGKFDADGNVKAIPGHNLVLVTLGVFILWLGWFGFNPGSTMAADANSIAKITVNTNAAAAMSAIAALITARLLFGKWEATMALNGVLAGLVAITCPCAWVSIPSSVLIGLVAGVLVVFSVIGIEKILRVDDPVGAISVHGVCGAWGTLALGLFSEGTGSASPLPGLFKGGDMSQLISQATGVIAVFAWAMVTGLILFGVIKATIGLRVSPEEEREGLDYGEHGNEAYHGFVMVTTPEG
ncbi:MAG TPA: ammonium transporter [Lacipirellulaceae bacterium]|nr:ammonium transporter [Lacipirellulaceae bacterium]